MKQNQATNATSPIATPIPGNTKTTSFDVRLTHAKNVFWQHAQKLFPGYEVDDHNRGAIVQCMVYYLGESPEMYPDLNPKKGLMLTGGVGSGKSLLMEILQSITKGCQGYGFRIFKACDICDEYAFGSRGQSYGEQWQTGR